MDAKQYRDFAAKEGIAYGSMAGVDCESVAEAEAYLTDFPRSRHDFASCAKIEVAYTTEQDTRRRLCAALTAAGYTLRGGWFLRPGFRARASWNTRGWASIHLYRDTELVAMNTDGEGNELPESIPQV